MKMRSIILRPDEVRTALKDGNGQLRRAVKPAPPKWIDKYVPSMAPGVWLPQGVYISDLSGILGKGRLEVRQNGDPVKCPFKVGETRWVKETAIEIGHERTKKNGQYYWPVISGRFTEETALRWFDQCCLYLADLHRGSPEFMEPHGILCAKEMPAWASRLNITLTVIRVEIVEGSEPVWVIDYTATREWGIVDDQ